MAEESILVRQLEVAFYEDQITAVLLEDEGVGERIYIPMPQVCRHLGLDWAHQRRRLAEDPILKSETKGVRLSTAPSEDGRGGGEQTVTCLPLEMMHGWLFSLATNRVKPEVREALLRYKRECYAVLSRAFTAEERESRRALDDNRALMERIAAGEYVDAELSKRQLETEDRVEAAHTRIDRAGVAYVDLAREVAAIKARIGLGTTLTPVEATAVRQRVNEVAGLLGGIPGFGGRRKPHAAVWSEVYRMFGVPSYRELTRRQYDDVVSFLDSWADQMQSMLEDQGAEDSN